LKKDSLSHSFEHVQSEQLHLVDKFFKKGQQRNSIFSIFAQTKQTMSFLLLSIISSTFITLVFKLISQRKIDIFSCIVVNYPIACLLGFAFANFSGGFFLTPKFVSAAVIVGILFVITFYLIGLCTAKAGMSTTTIASKMSLAIPISISFIFDSNDIVTSNKIIGISLAILAVILTTFKKNSQKANGLFAVLLPAILFFSMGLTDSMVKLAQLAAVSNEYNSNFSAIAFGIAGIIGLATLFATGRTKNLKDRNTLLFGTALGVANFGSLLFFLYALNSNIASSLVFGINNVAIVVLSVTIGILFFKEKLSAINIAGALASIISLIYLASI
jgi:drug/metabolite transporter (DMT)-like permease